MHVHTHIYIYSHDIPYVYIYTYMYVCMYVCRLTYHSRVSYFNFIHYILHILCYIQCFDWILEKLRPVTVKDTVKDRYVSVLHLGEGRERVYVAGALFVHFAGPCSDCWNDVVLILGNRGSGCLPTVVHSIWLVYIWCWPAAYHTVCEYMTVFARVCIRTPVCRRMHAVQSEGLLAQPFEQLFSFML